MKDYMTKIVMLVIGVILSTILLPTRNQVGQATTQFPAKTTLGKVLSKHSALPPVAQFGTNAGRREF